MTINFSSFKCKNKVFYLTKSEALEQTTYIKVRQKEQRVLSNTEIIRLPNITKFEWPLRVKSTQRITNYISKKDKPLCILDIGCGNGWFTNRLASLSIVEHIIGLDINTIELEQAANLFTKQNMSYCYGEIFKLQSVFKNQFDIITLNGSIQYFKDFLSLINTLKTYLKADGEIHILDSPFYKTKDINVAKQRTLNYYTKLGFPEMAQEYYHHDIKCVSNFDVLYRNQQYKIAKLIGEKDSPFSWYCYVKPTINS